ncbi:MAG: hypothetical protein DMF57_02925 [Acidobacteria bacterium]|nr:MAG: hypothetical protein DMF57_02925 [Acidobacteriota bacterium]
MKKRLAFLLALATISAAPLRMPTANAIAGHMRFLASDLLEGREPGTRGFEIAAEYVAAQFAAVGLRPLEDRWFQNVPLRAARVNDTDSSLSINGHPLVANKDYILRSTFGSPISELSAPAVFVGFGIVAPALQYDDYAGVDARGKVVVMISGAPAKFPTDQRAYYSEASLKTRIAAERGAVAVITVQSITDEPRYPFAKRAEQSGMPLMRFLEPDGRPSDVVEGIRGVATLDRPAAAQLFAGASMTLDAVLADAEKGFAHSFPLNSTVAMRTASVFEDVKSENVVGVLRGSDAKLRNETVVVSAHLDHLGNHSPAKGGDSIYNGAYDNASGIACLIEIARGLVAAPPRRSVIFVALTGEEKGLQGSKFFVRHPPVPRSSIVADVNMDMFLMLYPVADLIALGGEHTSIGPLAARAANAAGMQMSPDPYPEEVRFIRSDQFSFVEGGIPAIHLKPGIKSLDPALDGAAITRNWLRRVYHSPADDMSQHFDFASGARYVEANLRLVKAIADAPERPTWNRGDFFSRP